MGADHDHNIRPYRDHNIRPYRNYFTHFQGKPGLDTARLQEIYDYLSQLQAPYGFIPESLNEPFDPYDSSQWDSQLLKDPNPAAGILPSQNVMENPDYSYIPVGQATYTPQWTEDMGELELIDWRRKELEDFWGGEKMISNENISVNARANTSTTIYNITDIEILQQIPIVRWKMLEQTEKRE